MFQEIRNTLGQKDQSGRYQAKTPVTATIKRVKDVEFSKKSGRPGQSLQIQVGGEDEWIKLIGKFDTLDSSFEGKSFDFLVWPFQPDGSPKSYLYAWIQRQSNSQSSPQGRQATQGQITAREALSMLDKLVGFVASLQQSRQAPPPQVPPQQQYQPNPDHVGDDPLPPDDDDIPF